MQTKSLFQTIVISVFVIGCLLLCSTGLWMVGVNNTAATNDEGVNEQWAQVGVSLQRRADLYQTAVAIIKGASAQDLAIFTVLRDQAAALSGSLEYGPNGQPLAPQTEAEAQALEETLANFNEALVNVMVYMADNPDQVASIELYKDFLVQVEGTENRIATERRRYNEVVETARNHCRVFPNNIACGMFGYNYQQWTYFQPDPDAFEVPEVDFIPATPQLVIQTRI